MLSDPARIALAVAVGLFFVFLLFKLIRPSEPESEAAAEARRRIAEAKRRARQPDQSPAASAAAWREAAQCALQDLRRPSVAASYAHRAERVDPQDEQAVGLVALALRRAARLRALERLLWRRLAAEGQDNPAAQRALRELIALYDGPLRRPEIANALKKLFQGP